MDTSSTPQTTTTQPYKNNDSLLEAVEGLESRTVFAFAKEETKVQSVTKTNKSCCGDVRFSMKQTSKIGTQFRLQAYREVNEDHLVPLLNNGRT